MQCISVPKPNCGGTRCRLPLSPNFIANLNDWRSTMHIPNLRLITALSLLTGGTILGAGASDILLEADDWKAVSPRDEIRPTFAFQKDQGPNRGGSLIIRA